METGRELPAYLDTLYGRREIETRLQQLAAEMDLWAKGTECATGKPLLVCCVLRGGVFFFSDLLQQMRQSVEPGFCRAASYAKTENGVTGEDMLFEAAGLEVAGRTVVMVDNICDRGRTFRVGCDFFLKRGVKNVRTVALVRRLREDPEHVPTLSGFDYRGDEWLAGYGMRDQGRLMNFPEVYRVRKQPA
jgi:hypoxanthine phosphoribosyltransferase